MRELVQTVKKSGKQNKKKWNKTIDTSGLLTSLEKSHTEALRSTFKKPVVIQTFPPKSQALDPNRFKKKEVDAKLLSKTQKKYMDRINLADIEKHKREKKEREMEVEELEDAWGEAKVEVKKFNEPKKRVQEQDIYRTPAVMQPLGGESYNPSAEDFEQLADKIIAIEGTKPAPAPRIKTKKIQKQTVRIRNKLVRKQQLEGMERKRQRIREHYQNNLTTVEKQIDQHIQKGLDTTEKNLKKKEELVKERKSGWISKGPKIVKSRMYQYKAEIGVGKEVKGLSKVEWNDSVIRDRMDSVFRRGMLEVKAHSANPRVKKSMKVRPPAGDDKPYW